jgi:uncharacterized repeat protein (TIGR03803 family)
VGVKDSLLANPEVAYMKAKTSLHLASLQLVDVVFLFVTASVSAAATLSSLVSFGQGNGAQPPRASMVQGLDGNLYGTTSKGGSSGCGTVFRMTPAGALSTTLSFDGTNGCGPNGLALGADGNFYGTTFAGGISGVGTAFKVTLAGKLITLFSFSPHGTTGGANPASPLLLGRNGALYGTTKYGGTNNGGTIFGFTNTGLQFQIHSFGSSAHPVAALIQGMDGKLYGTTKDGGRTGSGAFSRSPPTASRLRLSIVLGLTQEMGKTL